MPDTAVATPYCSIGAAHRLALIFATDCYQFDGIQCRYPRGSAPRSLPHGTGQTDTAVGRSSAIFLWLSTYVYWTSVGHDAAVFV
jgi:hypothetical protein